MTQESPKGATKPPVATGLPNVGSVRVPPSPGTPELRLEALRIALDWHRRASSPNVRQVMKMAEALAVFAESGTNLYTDVAFWTEQLGQAMQIGG